MSNHSIIPPSSASIWGPRTGCPGWLTMVRNYPETEKSAAAEEGTAAHELAAMMLIANTRAGLGFPELDAIGGQTASNGVAFNSEMYAGAKMYADHVTGLFRKAGVFAEPNLGIEVPVRAPSVHPESFGTPDFYLYDKENSVLHIFDFKYGFGLVEVWENWQLLNYAIAVIDTLGIDPNEPLVIRLNIVQPRAFHPEGTIREWMLTSDEARPYWEQLRIGAAAAFSEDPVTHSGGHCRYCAARHACGAVLNAGMQLFEVTSDSVPLEMSVGEMAFVYRLVGRASELLKHLSLGYETELKALARGGVAIPGFRAQPTSGHKAWTKPYEEIIKLGELLGEDLRQQKPVTPLQAENMGVNSAVIDSYSERPDYGVKLVKDDGLKARKVFKS